MKWLEMDAELQAEGWSLQLYRHHQGGWFAFYGNVSYLPASGKGDTHEEAIEKAYSIIKERE